MEAPQLTESEVAVCATSLGTPGVVGGVVSLDPVDGQAAVLIDADARGETLPFVSDASTPIV